MRNRAQNVVYVNVDILINMFVPFLCGNSHFKSLFLNLFYNRSTYSLSKELNEQTEQKIMAKPLLQPVINSLRDYILRIILKAISISHDVREKECPLIKEDQNVQILFCVPFCECAVMALFSLQPIINMLFLCLVLQVTVRHILNPY